jgi:hypothetical protein
MRLRRFDLYAGQLEVSENSRLFVLPTPEQAQDAAFVLFDDGPSK